MRGYDSWQMGASKSVAITTLLMDRLLGFVVLSMFAVAALAFERHLTVALPGVYVAVTGAAAMSLGLGWLFLRSSPQAASRPISMTGALPPAVRSRVDNIVRAFLAYRGKVRPLTHAFLLSVVLQVNVVTFYYCLGRAMDFPIAYPTFFLLVPIALFVMQLPISINAIGVRESIFVLLLAAFGVQSGEAVAFAWLEHGLFLLYGILGGVVFAMRRAPATVRQESLAAVDVS